MELDALADFELVCFAVLGNSVAFSDTRLVFACFFVLEIQAFVDLRQENFVLKVDRAVRVDCRQRGEDAQPEHTVIIAGRERRA